MPLSTRIWSVHWCTSWTWGWIYDLWWILGTNTWWSWDMFLSFERSFLSLSFAWKYYDGSTPTLCNPMICEIRSSVIKILVPNHKYPPKKVSIYFTHAFTSANLPKCGIWIIDMSPDHYNPNAHYASSLVIGPPYPCAILTYVSLVHYGYASIFLSLYCKFWNHYTMFPMTWTPFGFVGILMVYLALFPSNIVGIPSLATHSLWCMLSSTLIVFLLLLFHLTR